MRILLINGPNLNTLGQRQPHIYGALTLADIVGRARARAQQLGAEIVDFQSNHEGALIDFLQQEAPAADGIIINGGAYTHTSIALRDALAATDLPIIEVHISNLFAREEFRHHSYISGIARALITGMGWRGYLAAVDGLVGILQDARGKE